MRFFPRARLAAAAAGLLALSLAHARADGTVRVGYQKYGTLILLKERAALEPALAKLGWTVKWSEFTSGPQLMEAFNAGALDFATTGETPPIFAEAAGTPLLYVGTEPPAPKGEAIVVPPGSTITSVAELRGKRVALNKGSNVHALLVRALEAAGLHWSDITPVYLSPPDGRVAFASGRIDAWAIWDPYLASAQADAGARILADAAGLVPNHQFYLASRPFTTAQPAIVGAILAQIGDLDRWAAANPAEVAPLLAHGVGLPVPTVEIALARLSYGVVPITPDIVAQQQAIADNLQALHLIPAAVDVAKDVWHPPS